MLHTPLPIHLRARQKSKQKIIEIDWLSSRAPTAGIVPPHLRSTMIDFASAHYRTDTHGCALITVLSAFARPDAFDPLHATYSPLHKRSSTPKPLRLFVSPLAAERERKRASGAWPPELKERKKNSSAHRPFFFFRYMIETRGERLYAAKFVIRLRVQQELILRGGNPRAMRFARGRGDDGGEREGILFREEEGPWNAVN